MAKPKPMLPTLLRPAIVLTAVLFLYTACKKSAEQIQPKTESITESVYASGVIKSKNQYDVHSTVSGLLQQTLVKEGSLVKKGDPIFVVSGEASRLNTENARLAAEFAAVQAQQDKLNELRANIDLARQKLRNDSILMVRQQSLWAQQIGSKVELEARELAFSGSKTALETAILRYNELRRQLQFSAEQAQKNLSISRTLQNDYTIKSLADGRVFTILVENGEIVTPQMPLAVVGDASDYYIELQVDEFDIVRLRPGQKVLLSLDSYKGQSFEAVIDRIHPIMNERTRTFVVEASFVRKPEVLYPNLTAEANIVVRTKQQVLTIPRAFLVQDSFVMLKNEEKRRVETGLKDYQKVEILSGLSASDIIIKPEK